MTQSVNYSLSKKPIVKHAFERIVCMILLDTKCKLDSEIQFKLMNAMFGKTTAKY